MKKKWLDGESGQTERSMGVDRGSRAGKRKREREREKQASRHTYACTQMH